MANPQERSRSQLQSEAEILEEKIRQTTSSMNEKIDALEEQLEYKISSTISDTAEEIEASIRKVSEVVSATSESVGHNLRDLTKSIDSLIIDIGKFFGEIGEAKEVYRQKTWVFLGTAFLCGFIGSQVLQTDFIPKENE